MVSRAAHYRAKAKHDQRPFGERKPKMINHDETTTWIPEFMSSIEGLTAPFNVNSIIAAQLGATEKERMLKLRDLSRRGLLVMSAYRENGVFIEYRWTLVN